MRAFVVAVVLSLSSMPVAAQLQLPDAVARDGFEDGLAIFRPAYGWVLASQSSAAVSPESAFVALAQVASADTFVAIGSSDPARLSVPGAGVTVPGGTNFAAVPLTSGAAAAAPVVLTATLGTQSRSVGIRVERPINESGLPAEADFCNVQFPTSITAVAGTPLPTIYGRLFEASVTPAAGPPPGWVAQLGIGSAGSQPTVAPWVTSDATYNVQVVNDDEFQASATAPFVPGTYSYAYRFSPDGGASWTWCDIDGAGSNPGSDLGTGFGVLTVTPVPLVINEVDYDQPGTGDAQEFVELRNNSMFPVNLARFRIVLVNGNDNNPYDSIPLSGTLAPGQYLVVGSDSVAVAPGALVQRFTGAQVDHVQNGAPDGVAVVEELTGLVIDALSYEGSITAANIPIIGIVSLVEGTPLPVGTADSNTAPGSLSRLPNGIDTNNAASDWSFSTTPTPGAANVP